MKSAIKIKVVLLLTLLTVACCSSDPVVQNDPYNDADSQRSRAKQTQDELFRETGK